MRSTFHNGNYLKLSAVLGVITKKYHKMLIKKSTEDGTMCILIVRALVFPSCVRHCWAYMLGTFLKTLGPWQDRLLLLLFTLLFLSSSIRPQSFFPFCINVCIHIYIHIHMCMYVCIQIIISISCMCYFSQARNFVGWNLCELCRIINKDFCFRVGNVSDKEW